MRRVEARLRSLRPAVDGGRAVYDDDGVRRGHGCYTCRVASEKLGGGSGKCACSGENCVKCLQHLDCIKRLKHFWIVKI